MFKNYQLIIIALSILILNEVHSTSIHKTKRHLDDIFELYFIRALNLTFDAESRWSFGIEYGGTLLSNTSKYYVSILYKGHPSLVSCDAEDNYRLKCILGQDGQTKTDLIQLNSDFTTGATIKWKDLYQIYDMPINTTLNYEDSYELKYDYSNNYLWEFKVKISEDTLLPENSKVTIDLYYDSNTKLLVSSCSHRESMLYCSFNKQRSNNYLIKIPPTKFSGSIEWGNLEANQTIPLYCLISGFDLARNLEFIDDKWNYNIQITTDIGIASKDTLITINTKLVRNGDEKIYFTKCLTPSESSSVAYTNTYRCTVFGENQNHLDLVYISNSENNAVSSKWNMNNFNSEDLNIIRKANLTFKRIYDLEYNKNWKFKIDTEEDEMLPQNAKVSVDIRISTNNYGIPCTFLDHILDCTVTTSSALQTQSFLFRTEIYSGSVTWNHLRPLYISIPLNQTFTFVNSSYAYFTDKWYFMVYGKPTSTTPKNVSMLIDIIHQNIETTATCHALHQGSSNTIICMFCCSNAENQLKTDDIKISINKKYGSITWNQGINDDNNAVTKVPEDYLSNELTYLNAYDMYYANQQWFFTLITQSRENKNKIGLVKVDISVLRKSSTTTESHIAECLLYYYTSNIDVRFLCSCQYDNQDQEDLVKFDYSKKTSETSTITWIRINADPVPISLLATLEIVDSRLSKINNNSKWRFMIDIYSQNLLPINSKVVIDAISSSSYNKVSCNVTSQTTLACDTDFGGSADPKLSYKKSLDSSVTWTNEDSEDYFMIREASLMLYDVHYLYFDTEKSKWNFNISVTYLTDAKVIIDVLYGNEATTATCKGGRNYLIHCVVDKAEQNKNTLVKLNKQKSSGSTVTWTNLNEDKKIPLYTELTVDKIGKLRLESGWVFDIYIKDNGIPEDSLIIVDLEIVRAYGSSSILYTKKYNSIANCIHLSKKLTCNVITSDRTDDKPYEFTPKLLLTKIPTSSSSVYKWNEATADDGIFILDMSLDFNFATLINKESDDKYYFYIDIGTTNKIPYMSKSIIDIKIDNDYDTSNCIAINSTMLKCEIKQNTYNPEKKYYICSTKHSETSSITWNNVETDQYLFPIQLKYIYAYKFDMRYFGPYFNIIVSGGSELKNKLILPVKIAHIVNGQRSNSYERILNLPCVNTNDVLKCKWYSPNVGANADWDLFRVKLLETGDNIQWENPSNDIIDGTMSCLAYYEGLAYIDYDNTNKYYTYSIQLSSSLSQGDILVMDLIINNINRYGFCKVKENRKIMECITPPMAKSSSDKILVKKDKNIGIMEWREITEDKQILPNDLIFMEISQIYDLQFSSQKWQFKILPKNAISFDGVKKLSILYDNYYHESASCTLNEGVLNCIVDRNSQFNYNLVKLDTKLNDDYLRLYNLRHEGIPLLATLELISSSDIKYNNNEWSFILKVKNINPNLGIPTRSTFSVDIMCGSSPELAFCDLQTKNDQDLTLLCKPKDQVSKETLISLSGTKTTYASITWTETLTENELNIYFSPTLSISYVSDFEYDGSKWKFNIYTSNADLPLNAKVKIDISYNSEETTATCTYIAENNFECVPDVEPQNSADTVRILGTKNKGSVTFTNPESINSKFVFNYVKAYGLKFEASTWKFNIELVNSNGISGNKYEINILVDDEDSTAECTYNSNNFECVVKYNNQDNENIIKLIKYKGERTDITWNNFPDELTLYSSYTINYINSNGGFYEGKWRFNIYHSIPDPSKKLFNNYVLLDIIVNDNESTAKCEITYSSFLKCVSEHENQQSGDIIKIDTSKAAIKGSITFNSPTTGIVYINYASFSLNYELNLGYSNQNDKLEILIEGKLEEAMLYDLEEETVTKIKISKGDNEYDIACLTNNIKKESGSYIYLTCPTELPFDKNKAKIKIDSEGKSHDIKFIPDGDKDIYFV